MVAPRREVDEHSLLNLLLTPFREGHHAAPFENDIRLLRLMRSHRVTRVRWKVEQHQAQILCRRNRVYRMNDAYAKAVATGIGDRNAVLNGQDLRKHRR